MHLQLEAYAQLVEVDSLDEIAERSNLSASTVSRIETGKRALSIDVLVPLAAALQVSVDDLLRAVEGELPAGIPYLRAD